VTIRLMSRDHGHHNWALRRFEYNDLSDKLDPRATQLTEITSPTWHHA
jgi:hypothetical protein